MKNLKSKLRLSLCLLIVCFSTFAQTDSHDCEIVVTRADLEKCATYKRQNELLEKEVKFQAVEAVILKDTLKARNETVLKLQKTNKEVNSSLDFWKKVGTIEAIILIVIILLIAFGPKIMAKIGVFILFSSVGFAQVPDYRPPFTLNGQKGLIQKIVYDTTANKFSIESANDIHTFKIPYGKLYINPGNQFQYYRGDKTWQTLNKDAVGLNNVDNTSDLDKPISTETQAALNLKQGKIDGFGGYDETNNGHVLTSDFGAITWRKLSVTDLTDFSSYAPVAKFNNVTITDSSSFTHSLGTQRINVAFFEAGYKEITILDWYPDSTNTIKVYLPYRDKPTKYKFVGDVFITKRY